MIDIGVMLWHGVCCRLLHRTHGGIHECRFPKGCRPKSPSMTQGHINRCLALTAIFVHYVCCHSLTLYPLPQTCHIQVPLHVCDLLTSLRCYSSSIECFGSCSYFSFARQLAHWRPPRFLLRASCPARQCASSEDWVYRATQRLFRL